MLPGAIDTHPHFFEPGPTTREDIRHGTQAAASGGFTSILDMPNTTPPVMDECTFSLKQNLMKKNSLLDYGLWGSSMPTNLDELSTLQKLGCIAFKAFTLDAGPDFDYSDEYTQLQSMRLIQNLGSIYGAHAENGNIVDHNTQKYRNKPWSIEVHNSARPWEAELTAINTLLLYARITGCRLHICHMSIPEGARLIQSARAEGVDVTVETCPHYLTLNTETASELGTFAMINPPLRSPKQMEQLWEYVLDGTINYLGTDHAPYLLKDKLPDSGDLWEASPGAPCIDIAIPLLLEEGVIKRGMDMRSFAAFTSTNAAKRFGLYPRKGTLKVGSDADFMIVSLDDEPWIYSRDNTFSKSKVNHFAHEGRLLHCRVLSTFLRGHAIYQNKKILRTPGYGKFLCTANS